MYKAQIKKLATLTVDGIITTAKRLLGDDIKYQPWSQRDLKHGTALLESEEALNAYIAAYGLAHKIKIEKALETLKSEEFKTPVEVFDWGCGQGLASLCLIEHLRNRNLLHNLKRITLVEPSKSALERARFNIKSIYKNVEIISVNKGLPASEPLPFEIIDDIKVEKPLAIHLFSNILDIPTIDLRKLSALISSSGYQHYVLCIGPSGLSERPIDGFCNNFERQKAIYYNFDNRSSEEIDNREIPIYKPYYRNTEFYVDLSYKRHTFGCYIRVFKFDLSSGEPVLVPYKFFAPKQFRAAYKSDLLESIPEMSVAAEETAFDVLAPFDIGASVYEDIHPVIAVMNNIIVRGLPTKASPFIENIFADLLGVSSIDTVAEKYGEISYKLTKKRLGEDVLKLIKLVPLGVARIQKMVIEAILTGRISVESDRWKILVKEGDVPCAAIAFKELADLFNHIASATRDYDHLQFPAIDLSVINSGYQSSSLHLGCDVHSKSNKMLRAAEYDMVIDFSIHEKSKPLEVEFSEFKAKNECYFNVRSVASLEAENYIYTSDRIVYKPLTTLNSQGVHDVINENADNLRYFVQLLFRKQNFREGQLPIISRALQLKSVIGLLPTGGGKSLTYQISAMLQPGVTIVIDPLVSLMKDQYDGLRKCGIDICTYINATVSNKAAREREMKESKKLFVLLSPERLAIFRFRESLRAMRDNHVYFSYGVIDEVHCVSEWGHDFRFAYLHLGRNLYQYVQPKQTKDSENNHITLIGLTATASFDVLADVERELSGNSAFPLDPQSTVRYENTNRLELQYRVVHVSEPAARDKWDVYAAKNKNVPDVVKNLFYSSMSDLLNPSSIAYIKNRFLERENIDPHSEYGKHILAADLTSEVDRYWYRRTDNQSSAIVFCPHREGSIGVNNSLAHNGVAQQITEGLGLTNISRYCGGDLLDAQDDFIQGNTNIMVATKAFGMGIDKPNVRFTLNVNHSGSLEAYVQEAGRAGRDRKMALSVILYNDQAFNEQDPNTRLIERVPVDFGVHKFFYDGNFIGPRFERRVMHYLMTQQNVVLSGSDGTLKGNNNVSGFLTKIVEAEVGDAIVAYISYRYPSKDSETLDGLLLKDGLRPIGENRKNIKEKQERYYETLMKAIYRMCCLGVIDDYTQDYSRKEFRIVAKKLAPGSYYRNLQSFLERYFSEDRAAQEVEKAKKYPSPVEIFNCLSFLTDFIYSNIAAKRKRAIQDIDDFCKRAISSNDHWLKVNEDLKDDIYFYFNSKYARPEYIAPNGESFSLVKDTDEGRIFDFDHVLKYMRVVDDNLFQDGGTSNDNVKHLQGAVRLVRRSITGENPTLDFLNVFCLFYLKAYEEGTPSGDELERSYITGYRDLKKLVGKEAFFDMLNMYKKELLTRNIITVPELKRLEELELLVELKYHVEWATRFNEQFAL